MPKSKSISKSISMSKPVAAAACKSGSAAMDHDSTSKTFWRFAIPSIVAMLVNGLYQLIDGIFVGHYIGYEGLAGINLTWPVIGILTGLGLLIGMGAGSLMSIFRGEDRADKAQQTLATGLLLTALLALLSMLVLHQFSSHLMTAQGATGSVLTMSMEYIDVFSWGAFVTIAASALPMLIRNDDRPNLSTALMASGALLNIVLDYLFIGVFDFGLQGAAVATVIAQLGITIIALGYFVSKHANLKLSMHQFRFKPQLAKQIINLGMSSLFMYVYFSFMLALHNMLFLRYGSAIHVSAYAIVGYLVTMYYLLAEGIATGMQPPVSYYFGARQGAKINATMALASKAVILSGIACLIILNAFPHILIGLFSHDEPQLAAETVNGIRLHLFGMFLDGFIALASVYFMAVNQGGKALAISVGNMLMQLPFLYFLPPIFGINGIWLAIPLSNITLACIVIPAVWYDLRNKRQLSPA